MGTNDFKYMISVDDLSKSYGTNNVLNELDLKVVEGELVIISGSNGSGKTTLHLIMSSLISADRGDIEISGVSARDNPEQVRSNVGYVAHDPFLYPSLTVRENLNFFSKIHNLSFGHILNLTYGDNNLLELLGISDKLDTTVNILSHGYKKRVGIVCSLMHNPSVLLFDEPETGLDLEGFKSFVEILNLSTQMGKSVLITTHADLTKFKMEYTHYHLERGQLIP